MWTCNIFGWCFKDLQVDLICKGLLLSQLSRAHLWINFYIRMEPENSVFLLEFKKAFLSKPPWWPSDNNLPVSAGNRSLIPSPGTKIPHAVGQLSLSITATEPACYNNSYGLEPVFHNRRSHHHEKPMHCNRVAPTCHI